MTLAVTYSAWINAWSLREACAAVGVDLRVDTPLRDLPLPRLAADAQPRWLFFTDEASLRRALAAPRSARFLPERFAPELLDDKLAFAAYLDADPTGPRTLPYRPLGDAAGARYPLLLKARHSWVGDRKLPRGWVCADGAELATRRDALPAQQLRTEWFFLQQWLGDAPLRLLSVGGFFDADDESRNLALLTERVADYGCGPSSSAVLATVDDPLGLVGRAEHVLRRLRYRGPYEFEFIVRGADALALELNPRFWMQHGLFLAAGNGLVKRYLGCETVAERAPLPPQRLLWIDGTWLLRRVSCADRSVLALWREWVVRRGYRPVICPAIGASLRAALWRAFGGARP